MKKKLKIIIGSFATIAIASVVLSTTISCTGGTQSVKNPATSPSFEFQYWSNDSSNLQTKLISEDWINTIMSKYKKNPSILNTWESSTNNPKYSLFPLQASIVNSYENNQNIANALVNWFRNGGVVNQGDKSFSDTIGEIVKVNGTIGKIIKEKNGSLYSEGVSSWLLYIFPSLFTSNALSSTENSYYSSTIANAVISYNGYSFSIDTNYNNETTSNNIYELNYSNYNSVYSTYKKGETNYYNPNYINYYITNLTNSSITFKILYLNVLSTISATFSINTNS